jgi:hypothetical protein
LWGDSWSTLRTAATETLPLRIAEVMYHPADPTPAEIAAGFDDADDFEFVELVNTSDQSVDLSNVRFVESIVDGETEGIVFDFGQGTFDQLGPGDRALVVEDRAAFEFRYGTQLPVAGQWSGGLRNSSEQITLMVGERLLQQFTYQDDWHPATDGTGPSLEIIDPLNTELEGWNDAASWQPSAVSGGTPGTGSDARLPGDANGDGVFDSADLMAVMDAGQYEDNIAGNSTFETGDWNGDGEFNSDDVIYVLQFGHYQKQTPVPALANAAVAAALAADEMKVHRTARDHLFAQWPDART